MDICSSGHDEICYSERTCPICPILEDNNDTINDLESSVKSLEQEVKQLNDDINTYADIKDSIININMEK